MGQVREFSLELLLLHDHALSLRRTLHSAGLDPPPLCEASLPAAIRDADAALGEALTSTATPAAAAATTTTTTTATTTANPTSSNSKSTPALLLQSASLPRLSRLLRARGEQPLDRFLPESRPPERADLDERSNATGGRAAAAAPRARPRSAGVARRTTTTVTTTTQRASIPGAAAGLGPACRRSDSGVRGGGHRRVGRTRRPTSAPGRHPCGSGGGESWALGRHCSSGQVERGGGGWEGRGERALAGWNAQDLVGRDAGELSRDGLMRLIGTLRESLAGCEGNWIEEGNTEVGENGGLKNTQQNVGRFLFQYSGLWRGFLVSDRCMTKFPCDKMVSSECHHPRLKYSTRRAYHLHIDRIDQIDHLLIYHINHLHIRQIKHLQIHQIHHLWIDQIDQIDHLDSNLPSLTCCAISA